MGRKKGINNIVVGFTIPKEIIREVQADAWDEKLNYRGNNSRVVADILAKYYKQRLSKKAKV